MSTITESYNYGGGNEQEFVFSCRGRPFTALVSTFLPTPPSTLIDYGLVKDLNLKMTELQCRKFHYGGHKMRILGHVTTAVQTIKNGFSAGNFQFSAQVVLDLNKNLDTFSVAGHKMSKQLSSSAATAAADKNTTAAVPEFPSASWSPATSPVSTWSPSPATAEAPATSPKPKRSPRTTKKPTLTTPRATTPAQPYPPSTPQGRPSPTPQGRPSPTPQGRPTPTFSPSSPIVLSSVTPKRAPPGFPVPIFGKDYIGKLPACFAVQLEDTGLSPRSENLRYFDKTFGGADKLDQETETSVLLCRYKDAILYDRSMGNLEIKMAEGVSYIPGHGEFKCNRVKCIQPGLFQQGVPNNCGFHRQWQFPGGFLPCGPKCRGGYCSCLSKYQN